ncbi:MAG: cyclopropane fatty acyl phospholipid synthase [Enterobacteriaceae bacterium]
MEPTCLEGHLNTNECYAEKVISRLLSMANITINGPHSYDIQIHHADFYTRILQQGSLGLGESYMDGWWDCDRLDQFFYFILRAHLDKQPALQTFASKLSRHLFTLGSKLINLQSIKRAWIVGKKHYDLGNDLFSAILDPQMQYSCGYWQQASSLEQAQQNKLELICRKLALKPGMTLLDVGCGWGGLAAFAARYYGVKVTGITISQQQQLLARERCQGLDVDIVLQDYRSLHESYDRIVSVGMFEHVGPRNYQTFFKTMARNLKPEGLFLLHTIGSNHSKNAVDPWINRYIFPNGNLPSVRHIATASEPYFVMEDWHNFGADYDKTLMSWAQRLRAAWPELSAHYSERFYRMFSYYLNSCAGAFRARDLQLWQILFSPQGVTGGIRVAR